MSQFRSATKRFSIVFAGLAFASMLCIFGAYATAGAAPAPKSTIVTIVASNWKFTPGTVTVEVNQATTFQLSSAGGVHGIQSTDLGIPSTTILPGKTVTVTFTPKKVGTFAVHCAVFCGAGHATMTLIVKVVP